MSFGVHMFIVYIYRVANGLENLEYLEKSGNLNIRLETLENLEKSGNLKKKANKRKLEVEIKELESKKQKKMLETNQEIKDFDQKIEKLKNKL